MADGSIRSALDLGPTHPVSRKHWVPAFVGMSGKLKLLIRMNHGHFTIGGIELRIDSTLPPVLRPNIVPRS